MRLSHLMLAMMTVPASALFAATPAAMVKTASPPAIDANPADWQTIQAEQTILFRGSRNEKAASYKLAYDARNLYALIQVIDDSPLRNGSARLEEIMKGGDAVGLLLGKPQDAGSNQRILFAQVNNKPVAMIYRPKSTEKKRYVFSSPVSSIEMDYVAPLTEAQVALKASGNGYVVEAAIPWQALKLTVQDGAKLSFDVQVIYSDPAGTTNTDVAWWNTTGGDAFTVEDLPTEARLYPESWGTAELFAHDPGPRVAQGTATVTQSARGVPIQVRLPRSGRFSLVIKDSTGWIVREMLEARPLTAGTHTFLWDGRDRYGEPLPRGEYTWHAALFDGVGAAFYGSVGNDSRPPFRTADGKGSMGGQHGHPQAVGADEGGIYMLGAVEEGHPGMRKIDPRTGVAIWKRSFGGFGAGRGVVSRDGVACFFNLSGKGNDRGFDLVRFDPRTGRDVAMGDAPARMKIPGGQINIGGAALIDRKVYFSLPDENRIDVVDLTNGRKLPSINLAAPQGLYHLDTQTLLVCSGNSVLAVPVAGGEPRVVVADLVEPRAVVTDPRGNLYVSDLGASQQIKKFSPAGKLIAAFGREGGKPEEMLEYDPMAFHNISGLAIDPQGHLWLVEESTPPRRFVKITTDGQWVEDFCGPVAYNTFGVDLDDPTRIYYNVQSPHLVEVKVDYEQYSRDSHPSAWKIVAIHDMTQRQGPDLMGGVAGAQYGHVIVFTASNGQRYMFRPAKENRNAGNPTGSGLWRWDGRWVPAAFFSKNPKNSPSWVDGNGDGVVQDAERSDQLPNGTFAWVDRDLKLHGPEGSIAPSSIDAHGVPQYLGGTVTAMLKANAERFHGGMVSYPAEDGSYYFAVNVGVHRHLSFWDRAAENRIVKVKDGQTEWVVGKHDPHPNNTEFSTLSGIAGVVDDLIIAHTVEPPNYVVLTPDGLTLGNIFGDQTRGARTGPTAIYIESFTGLFFKDPVTGKRLLLSVSSGDDRILEVTGPGRMDRMSGSLSLESALPRETLNKSVSIPYQTWYGKTARDLGIDGNDHEWLPEERGVPIYNDSRVLVADVRLRRDAGALHVLANVIDSSPLQAGEGVELLLAPGGADAGSALRVVFAASLEAKNGNAVLVQRPGEAKAAPVQDAQIAVVPRWRGMGYRIEAEIPLKELTEIAQPGRQTYNRGRRGNTQAIRATMTEYTEVLPDLVKPIGFNATVLINEDGSLRPLRWIPGEGENIPLGVAIPEPQAARDGR